MSEPESGQHPWDRYYAEKGRGRVEKSIVTKSGKTIAPFLRAGDSRPPTPSAGAADASATGPRPPTDSRAPLSPPALSRTPFSAPPVEAPPVRKIDWHNTPIVEVIDAAAQQRAETAAEVKRLREAWSLLRIFVFGLGAVLAAVLAFETAQVLANDRPRDAVLAAEGARVADEVLASLATPMQPLRVQSVHAEFFAAPEKGRADYDLIITLELTAPLHAPADSNGAQGYLQLQRAVGDAYARVMAQPALRVQGELQALPALPPLYAQTHRRGERLLVRVPLEAHRSGLRWNLHARPEQRRVVTPALNGVTLERLPQPHLVFNTPAGREEMRRRMTEARDYIVRVNKAAAVAVHAP